ncbi:MAG: HD domain-containing protein [bacterium]|nr:HD domain-containing protein [bacterium]
MNDQYKLNNDNIMSILRINEDISHIRDIDSLLDRVLLEARLISKADAGSIFLTKGGKLSFEYVQNDSMMTNDSSSNKYIYAKREIDINNESIAGYVAANKSLLLIDDVYRLDGRVPYTFNRSFDESSSYHTQSVLTVPLMTSRDSIIGVMQIINAKNDKGRVVPFSSEDEMLVSLFANQAAVAIERARMTRDIILRMIKMAELRDPLETGAHVNRVAAFSIEIYDRWARKQSVPVSDIKKFKDLLRISSMLHDVGKVAISDAILKKKGKLNDEEYFHIKMHTVHGAKLFTQRNSDWDDMAAEIALNHHEKWNGTGYPGKMENFDSDDIAMGPGKKETEIPLTARIVALADVYDALMSRRSYKDAWPEEQVLDYIAAEKNKHFDPDIVDAFLDIYDVIKAIRGKYTNGD